MLSLRGQLRGKMNPFKGSSLQPPSSHVAGELISTNR